MMRPKIEDEIVKGLEQKIDGTELYIKAGFTSKTAFVNHAVKEKVDREREKLSEEKENTDDWDF